MTRFFALLATCVALVACESVEMPRPVARGDGEQIQIVTDSATWQGPVGDAIRAELGKPVPTLPSSQGAFKLKLTELNSRTFPLLKASPHVMFVASVDAPGEIGDFIRTRVGESNLPALRSGQSAAVNLRPDLWANRQLITIATAASDSALAAQILDRGAELRRAYGETARTRTSDEMYARLRQTDLEDELQQRHGFSVGVQHDYVKTHDTTATVAGRTGEFIRYRRVLVGSWRDFFVFVQDGVSQLPTEAELAALTDGLLEEFARGSYDSSYVQTDEQRPMSLDTTTVAGRPALERRGLWYMTNDVMGGAYISHAWIDDGRLYLYYGMTFAPDRTLDKRKFLRQMEVIPYTFQSRADRQRETADS